MAAQVLSRACAEPRSGAAGIHRSSSSVSHMWNVESAELGVGLWWRGGGAGGGGEWRGWGWGRGMAGVGVGPARSGGRGAPEVGEGGGAWSQCVRNNLWRRCSKIAPHAPQACQFGLMKTKFACGGPVMARAGASAIAYSRDLEGLRVVCGGRHATRARLSAPRRC